MTVRFVCLSILHGQIDSCRLCHRERTFGRATYARSFFRVKTGVRLAYKRGARPWHQRVSKGIEPTLRFQRIPFQRIRHRGGGGRADVASGPVLGSRSPGAADGPLPGGLVPGGAGGAGRPRSGGARIALMHASGPPLGGGPLACVRAMRAPPERGRPAPRAPPDTNLSGRGPSAAPGEREPRTGPLATSARPPPPLCRIL